MKPVEAKYIWYDDRGSGRNLYGMFRKTFDITGEVQSACLHIFADTSYQLFINGEFIEFGPVRFDPRFPLYDTHNISPYLKIGRNVIAVLVNFIGHKTFKNIPAGAGLIGWGEVRLADGQVISLCTGKNHWKAKASRSYCPYAPKLSFALNAADIFDQGKEEHGWREVDFDDSHWPNAVELSNQNLWGELAPRSIPFMSGKPVAIDRIVHVLPLKKEEDWYSFEVDLSFNDVEKPTELTGWLAYSTWIYSPIDQTVTVGNFYGENWLNGEPVISSIESPNKSLRFNQQWNLKAGWNHYFGCIKESHAAHYHYIGLPRGKGLVVSADRTFDSPYLFKRTPVITKKDYENHVKGKALPWSSDDEIPELGGWIYTTWKDKAQSPCREASWDEYGQPFEKITPEELKGHVFPIRKYPHGFSIVMDLGKMNLFIPRIRMSGVRGATIDFIYSEYLNQDNQHLQVLSWIPLGDRVICSRDQIDWMTSHPRGTRYLSITVRNISGDVKIESIDFRSANYPFKSRGYFQCSDPLLNEIWKMGERTLMSNMEDAYVDCSGRERGMYGRDTIIQYHVNLATMGDQALMRRCMELFGQSPDETGKFRAVYPNTGDYTIADFALNMLEGYLNYYENTGDKALIEQCWEAMMKNLKWFHDLADEREDLLLDSEWDIHKNIKAMYGGFHGDLQAPKEYLHKTGIHCIFSCTYLDALQSAVKLARAIGKQEDEKELQRRVDILRRSIPEKFWDPEKGCFKDNLEGSSHSVHASLMAVRSGVVTEEQLESIKQYVKDQLVSVFVNGYDPTDGAYMSPNYAFYLLEALYKAGLEETAENVMRQGWGWALAQGLRTCPEYFELKNSLCHAWSACPTYYLSKYVLGVHFPKAPDLDYVEIKVQTKSITKAEGAYPHPKGLIKVKWHLEGQRRIFDVIEAPDGVEVVVCE